MVKYIEMPPGKLTEFFHQVKSQTGLNHVQLAATLGVQKSMITHYVQECCRLPYMSFLKLCSRAGINASTIAYTLVDIKCERFVRLPQLNCKLAEFIGILLGDGHLSLKKFKIMVTCGFIDFPYITKFVPRLMTALFGKAPAIHVVHSKGWGIQCGIYAKAAHAYLTRLGVPAGKKRTPVIPSVIMNDERLLKECLRGLIDTDGGLYRHHVSSAQLAFHSKTRSLAESVSGAFRRLGYRPSLSNGKRLFTAAIFSADVRKYFREIGSHNMKNILKYHFWKKQGTIPKQDVIARSIMPKGFGMRLAGIEPASQPWQGRIFGAANVCLQALPLDHRRMAP